MQINFRFRNIILWGLLIAIATFALQWLEYQYLLRRYSTETYIIILCVLFVSVGIWFGRNLVTPTPAEPSTVNTRALEALGFSTREIEVLALLSEGYSNSELADRLHVSVNTIKTHLKNIYEKLEVSQRGHAIRKARELRLLG